MRIGFLLFNLDGMGGTARAVITQANALADRHEVSLISVTRSGDAPHYRPDPRVWVDYLTEARDGREPRLFHTAKLSPSAERALAERPSQLIPSAWDAQFNALCDIALEQRLPRLELDILVTVLPALLAAAVQLAPDSVAIVHQEHRSTSSRVGGLEPLLAFAPRADAVALLTADNAGWLRDQLGQTAPPIVVVENALPTGFLPQSRRNRPVILAAGRLTAEKQFGHLIRAFAKIADDLPEWSLRICGDGGARVQLLATARKLGLFDRVELPGPVSDLAGEWAKASIGALSSVAEGFPLVLQEAMAAGVPVVSYDCPTGPRAIIDHERTGLLVTPDSIDALAEALRALATDAELRDRLGEAAREASHRWDPATIADRWEQIFTAVRRRRETAGSRRRLAAMHAATPDPAFHDPRLAGWPSTRGQATDGQATGGQPAADATAGEPSWRPDDITAGALSALTGVAAEVAGTDWFLIPERAGRRSAVVVPSQFRREFLTALATQTLPSVYCLRDPGDHGWPGRRGPVDELATALRRTAIGRISLEDWSGAAGVEVQFWTRSGDGLVAPVLNDYTPIAPEGSATATVQVHDITVPTLPVMVDPTIDAVSFPVDVVYTWVDGNDPEWAAAKQARLAAAGQAALARTASGRARFESRDELRYSLRSVHAFAPWVRRIFLVTAGQRPAWLQTDDRLVVVDHRDILPPAALPTFNSHAIETGLHRIPDLAEHFVYLNDDVFLGRPVGKELFFSPAGQFAAFVSEHVIGLPEHAHAPYLGAALNNRRLLQDAFGVTITHTMAHTPHPHRRSVLAEIEERFADAVSATASSPFRSAEDVSLLSNLAQHYGLITGSAVRGSIAHTFVDLSSNAVASLFQRLLTDRDQDSICLGDHHDYAFELGKVDQLLSDFWETYYPVASPWERHPST